MVGQKSYASEFNKTIGSTMKRLSGSSIMMAAKSACSIRASATWLSPPSCSYRAYISIASSYASWSRNASPYNKNTLLFLLPYFRPMALSYHSVASSGLWCKR